MAFKISVRQTFGYAFIAAYLVVLFFSIFERQVLWLFTALVPLHFLYFHDLRQGRHTLLRNYPIIGHLRYIFESIRPEFRQYFFESDLDGKPFSRRQRSIVYQRAKNVRQTVPFGMQSNSQEVGYEWIAHTMFPVHVKEESLRVQVGSSRCKQPYSASIYNISAMSYGSLSKTAVEALSAGAKLGGFAQNTGEGGVSPFHIEGGGDLIWQIGTGYFGCRDKNGNFSAQLFEQQVAHPHIKMVEIKLSQGAKPGHGGILPGAKNTPEIAAIRKVEPYTTVASPPAHAAFHDQFTMLLFIEKLRLLSGGKPVGIKLCIGNKQEFERLCQEMMHNQLFPDFVTIDGAEGGTGAAPLEFTDSLGMPLYDALAFAHSTLKKYGLRNEVKIIAAGKIITAVDIIKARALGADICYSARGMMFALGCIQALQCDSGRCPVGIATQDKNLYSGLDVANKRVRVANFHGNTIKSMVEVMEACGFASLSDISPDKVFRRVEQGRSASFKELYFAKGPSARELNQNYILN
ncbi:glutamate synthase domain-containing protein 2 [Pontibacter ummariensis]|uniref:Glutamate synthase domain-containing protein 2 n=1 Tax=Pontibacter ummariensis TaxID=1610492 RepID=A0A239F7V8_9BACT|nr:FMN-binding glutamate synthase family protein [Pontibacter ummariensis]PRY12382.1 glutamate synthase domain-containing protein 2 [Pontibacter ummariensis]SNS53009.1 Glutamate synthase domain-containing protein 2 [Pontibacter ummariensis]